MNQKDFNKLRQGYREALAVIQGKHVSGVSTDTFKLTTKPTVPVSYAKPNEATKHASHEKGFKEYNNTKELFKDYHDN